MTGGIEGHLFACFRVSENRGAALISGAGALGLICFGLLALFPAHARGHFFVVTADRVGASPAAEGSGWYAEVFLNIPEESAAQLLGAEAYIAVREPDFTFRTPYIDFPAGPADSVLDAELGTIGGFLNDYIFEVSDPALLDEPPGSFVIRFSGLLDVRFEHSTLGEFGLPALIDFATQGYGGYRTRIGSTSIYRVQDSFAAGGPLFTENALVLGLGLFPIQVTYLNRFDPDNLNGQERAGVELYSWHGGGLPWPAGEVLAWPGFGPMTVTPPRVVYQPEQIESPPKGDFDADTGVTLADYQGLQNCQSGPGPAGLGPQCVKLDFDADDDVDVADVLQFVSMLRGPDEAALLPGDFDADQRIDLADAQWLQNCFSTGGGEEDRLALDTGCEILDYDLNDQVDLEDYIHFASVLTGP